MDLNQGDRILSICCLSLFPSHSSSHKSALRVSLHVDTNTTKARNVSTSILPKLPGESYYRDSKNIQAFCLSSWRWKLAVKSDLFFDLKYWFMSWVEGSLWQQRQTCLGRGTTVTEANLTETAGWWNLLPAMWANTVWSSVRLCAENQWSLTSCSWELRPTTAGEELLRSAGRTDVSSVTEIVSMVTGDSGSGVGEAGKKKKRWSYYNSHW